MEGERQPPAVASAAISKVLHNNDDLLIEILLRIDFPTTLVRAALVCKRWFQHASDNKFLHRFRELHPPRLLGFYISPGVPLKAPCFIPMLPQPPQLDIVIRRTRFCLDTWESALNKTYIHDCRNGSVFTEHRHRSGYPYTLGVHNPLCPERSMDEVPPFPRLRLEDGVVYTCSQVHCREEEDGSMSYLYVFLMQSKDVMNPVSTVHVYMLQDGVWSMHASATAQLPPWRMEMRSVLVDNRIYMPAAQANIIIFDLLSSSISTIRLPQGVHYGTRDTMLSRADDDSGVYLIQSKEFQIHIWLHKGDDWLLVDTICMRQMVANFGMQGCTVGLIKQVGYNAEFVFFQEGRSILYLDIKCRTLHKVYEMTDRTVSWGFVIYPLKMIWPPAFPAHQV